MTADPVAPCGAPRRTLLAAGCAVAVAGVAGCARYAEPGSAPSAPQTPQAPSGGQDPAAPSPAQPQGGGGGGIPTSTVPVGGGVVLADQGVVVTQPTAGTFAAFGTTCPHQGCQVNTVADGTIDCPCHGSKFAIADGSVTDGPARSGLDRRQVTVNGSSLTVA